MTDKMRHGITVSNWEDLQRELLTDPKMKTSVSEVLVHVSSSGITVPPGGAIRIEGCTATKSETGIAS